jgi:16S rRNA (guanine527-N7)-methyltransferase
VTTEGSYRDRARHLAAQAAELSIAADEATCARLLAYLDAMLAKNRQLNLTGVRDPAQAEVLHVLDGLAVGLAGVPCHRALDLGSGNGFPGVAVAALWPDARVELMERTTKKARALEELLRATDLANVAVLHLDADQAPAMQPALRASFDLVTARAVAAPARVAQMAAPLTAPGGHLVLWLDAHTEVGTDPVRGFEVVRELSYDLPAPAARQRRLAVCRLSERGTRS